MPRKTRANKNASRNKRSRRRRTFRKKIGGNHDWMYNKTLVRVYTPSRSDPEINDNGFNAFREKLEQIEKHASNKNFEINYKYEFQSDSYSYYRPGGEGDEFALNDSDKIMIVSPDRSNDGFYQSMYDKYLKSNSTKIAKAKNYNSPSRNHWAFAFTKPTTFPGVFASTSTRGLAATDFFNNLYIKLLTPLK
jgi:hypothetical protein